METIKGREASLLKENNRELELLKELTKKVKVEGVKDGIDKVSGIYNALIRNRHESRALKQMADAQSMASAEIAKNIASMHEGIIKAV